MPHRPLRRRLLCAAGLLPVAGWARAATGRVVIVGGGWGGLSAARHLRQLVPALDVLLIDRQPAFISFALSNRWLVDASKNEWARHDYAKLADGFGYRFVQAEVQDIDRRRGTVGTSAGDFAYDWLVVAPGIREDWAAWRVDEPAAVAALRRHGSALVTAADLEPLKRRLQAFAGGDLLMTIPPAPYRCPPAPYERALFIAWWLKSRGIRGKLIVVDPNPIMPVFRAPLLEHYRDQVVYIDHARIRGVDIERKTLGTDIDDIRFDEALLAPPQQAAEPLWRAGLIRPADDGLPSGWAALGATDQRSPDDDRVFIVGDAAGLVSPRFGYFPKTGQIASRMGMSAARRIAAQATGRDLPPLLPDSECYVTTGIEPAETVRIETAYRDRGDGFLVQTVRQDRNPHPDGEDDAWARAMYAELLGE